MHKLMTTTCLILLLLALAACVSRTYAQLPACKEGCASVTCNITKTDAAGKNYCVQWDKSQAATGMLAYNADPQATGKEYKDAAGRPIDNTYKSSNEVCSADCSSASYAAFPASSGGCSSNNLTWKDPATAHWTYCDSNAL